MKQISINAAAICEDLDVFVAANCPRQPVLIKLRLPDRCVLGGVRRAALTIAGFAVGSTVTIDVEPGGKAMIIGAAGVHGHWDEQPHCGRPGGTAIEIRGEINVVFMGDAGSLLVLPGQGGDGSPGRGGLGKYSRWWVSGVTEHHYAQPPIITAHAPAGYVPGVLVPADWWRLFSGRGVHGGLPFGGGGAGGGGGGGGTDISANAEKHENVCGWPGYSYDFDEQTNGGAGGGSDGVPMRGDRGGSSAAPAFRLDPLAGGQEARREPSIGGRGGAGFSGGRNGQDGAAGGSGGLFLDNIGGLAFIDDASSAVIWGSRALNIFPDGIPSAGSAASALKLNEGQLGLFSADKVAAAFVTMSAAGK